MFAYFGEKSNENKNLRMSWVFRSVLSHVYELELLLRVIVDD